MARRRRRPVGGLASVGNFGVLWREQTDDVRARLRAAYDALDAPWRDGDDLVFDVECVVAEARVPRSWRVVGGS